MHRNVIHNRARTCKIRDAFYFLYVERVSGTCIFEWTQDLHEEIVHTKEPDRIPSFAWIHRPKPLFQPDCTILPNEFDLLLRPTERRPIFFLQH